MNIVDAFAWGCVAAVVGLLIAITASAYTGQGKRWFYGMLALLIALVGLAAVQFSGRGLAVFNVLAIAFFLLVGLSSGIVAAAGRWLRSKRSKIQVQAEGLK